MINEDYVSYETAQLLKSKGFDELCYACYEYFSSGVTMYSGWPFEYKGEPVHNTNDRVKCPTLQMAMKWLREEHNIFIQVDYIWSSKELYMYTFNIYNMKSARSIFSTPYGDSFNSYEEACEVAIKYCLTNLI